MREARSALACLVHGVALACAVLPAPATVAAAQSVQVRVLPAETGRIAGTVTLSERLANAGVKFSMYPDANRAARRAEAALPAAEVSNVVVYLEDAPPGASAARDASARMEQKFVSFHPHVLPVVRGTTVEFPNRDTLFHNVFSLSQAATFDLGRYPSGDSRSVTFDEPGIVKVFCHIHSDMSAVILVLDNSFFATPSADGRFVIEGVPPGEYRIAAWHERARPSVKRVTVEAGKSATLDFDIPLAEVPDGG
jgi:plastocyanin